MTRWTRRYLRTSQKSLERQIEGFFDRTDFKPNFGYENAIEKYKNFNFNPISQIFLRKSTFLHKM